MHWRLWPATEEQSAAYRTYDGFSNIPARCYELLPLEVSELKLLNHEFFLKYSRSKIDSCKVNIRARITHIDLV